MEDARDAIRRRLAQIKTFLAQESRPRLSESDTKAHFIEPIVAALGWEGIGVVTREYYVRNSQEFIDYVMAGPNGLLLAIEAKPLQIELTDKHAAQLIQYCAVEGIEWAALTNGRELQFFNTFLKPDLAAKRVLRLDLLAFNTDAEYDALFAQVWQLSRESMTKPSGVRTWLNQRRLDTALRAILLDPSSPTLRHLRKALADAEIAATPQDLAQWFRSHLGTPITSLPIPARQASSQANVDREPVAPSRSSAGGRPASPRLPFSTGDLDEVAGTTPQSVTLFRALRQAVDQRLPEVEWRATKYYLAAEAAGHTFLAVKFRSERLILGLTLPQGTRAARLKDIERQFNWARITKVSILEDESGIDEELLALIEAAQSHAASAGRHSTYFGVTLRDLVDVGLLPAGTPLVLIGRGRREVTRASLTESGEIDWQGRRFRSPSDRAFAALLGAKSLNGWDRWEAELPHGRVRLTHLRDRMRAGGGSETGPEERVG